MGRHNKLSRVFRIFAKGCHGSSPLYEHLSLKIAQDNTILEIASQARGGQPEPNLLFASVQFLLLKGENHLLGDFYGSIVDEPDSPVNAYPFFRSFCLSYRERIVALVAEKRVQTNEIRRASYLYPCFCYIYNQIRKPLNLIEIGTSTGLLLLWDKYGYTYFTGKRFGNQSAELLLESELRSSRQPPFLMHSPPVNERIGLDLHISDLTNPEETLWMKALIWPEHQDRRDLFEKAVRHRKDYPLKLIEGDGVTLLPDIVQQLPEDQPVCVFHTHVANQMPDETKHRLVQTIKEIGRTRAVFHLYNNLWDRKLHLDAFIHGIAFQNTVGETDGHGRWFTWELKE